MALDQHKSLIVDKTAELLISGNFADLTFRCSDGVELKAHRMVVCNRSPVIAAACSGPFEVRWRDFYSIDGLFFDFFISCCFMLSSWHACFWSSHLRTFYLIFDSAREGCEGTLVLLLIF
jgi:hypothetical protein